MVRPDTWKASSIALFCAGILSAIAHGQTPSVNFEKDRFQVTANERGDTLPDFSYCGYRANEEPLPRVATRIELRPSGSDDSAAIQQAIDTVGRLPIGNDGWRGAVVLGPGTFYVSGNIRLYGHRIVLRGTTEAGQATTIVATGRSRRALIDVGGNEARVERGSLNLHDPAKPRNTDLHRVTAYVPIGSRSIVLDTAEGLTVGQSVIVRHRSTDKWIDAIGMNRMPTDERGSWLDWKAGAYDQVWLRTISKVDGQSIELDVPLTGSLDPELAESEVSSAKSIVDQWGTHLGVENLRLISWAETATNPKDEEHAWDAIRFDRVQHGWVRGVSAQQFSGSAVLLGWNTRFITVSDCLSKNPVSEEAAWRRQSYLTYGQQCLFLRCQAEDGRHDFAVGYLSAGPNAFSYCEARRASRWSGPLGNWATGVLYDNVTIDGHGLALTNRETDAQGAGWAAANCVLWNCVAPQIICRRPPTAYNWAIGVWGEFTGDGYWRSMNEFVKPDSLIKHQLRERTSKDTCEQVLCEVDFPVPEVVDCASLSIPDKAQPRETSRERPRPDESQLLQLKNGWLTIKERVATGARQTQAWWRGSTLPAKVAEFGPGLTRYVPGIEQRNYTDSIEDIAGQMQARNALVLEQHWGLWYDRRRDDHQMVRRASADVWAPFYELPWARSGQGQAWDGLSKYDLTRFNSWYFDRLASFAETADERGLVLMHSMYFQHNILEAGAHWADFAWRPANALQATGFLEPPVYRNRKRVFMADAFYDLSHPLRHQLHTQYIRHCLDVLGNNRNVLFVLSEEYTGPAHFAEFWLRTIAQWEREHDRNVYVVLSATRDVQEKLLSEPELAALIEVIDMKYWWITRDGQIYDPRGGENLAPRQQLREWKGSKNSSTESLARGMRELRLRYPGKAVICSVPGAEPWMSLAAGASLVALPPTTDAELLKQVVQYQPMALTANDEALVGRLRGTGDSELVLLKSAQQPPGFTEIGSSSDFTVYWKAE